jgi:hypothetical protein
MPRSRDTGLGVAICLLAAASAAAQSRPQAFVNVNVAMQDGPQKLAVSVPAPVFDLDGSIDVDDRIAGATLMDVSGGLRGRRFLVGAGYFRTSVDQSHEFTASTTPASPGGFTRTLSYITPGLEHRESVFYLAAGATRSVTDKFDFSVSAGPAFFKVRQALPEFIIQGPLPFGEFQSMLTRTIDDSAIGFQSALDLDYLFHPRVGIGATVRYSYASIELPDATESMTLGGVQFGAGIRIRF